MDREKMIQLYELLGEYSDSVREMKKSEYDTNVLFEMQKELNAIQGIRQTIALGEFTL